jgi:spermidine/putrescine-binding protein
LRLLNDSNSYDLAVPSTYYVSKMRKEGLLHKLEKNQISNFSNYNTRLVNQEFDPGNEYSAPYVWGSTGIGVNTAVVKTFGMFLLKIAHRENTDVAQDQNQVRVAISDVFYCFGKLFSHLSSLMMVSYSFLFGAL